VEWRGAGRAQRAEAVEGRDSVQRDEATADVAVATENEIVDVIGGQDTVFPDERDDASVSFGQSRGELCERVI
jgi:hypothetical protein